MDNSTMKAMLEFINGVDDLRTRVDELGKDVDALKASKDTVSTDDIQKDRTDAIMREYLRSLGYAIVPRWDYINQKRNEQTAIKYLTGLGYKITKDDGTPVSADAINTQMNIRYGKLDATTVPAQSKKDSADWEDGFHRGVDSPVIMTVTCYDVDTIIKRLSKLRSRVFNFTKKQELAKIQLRNRNSEDESPFPIVIEVISVIRDENDTDDPKSDSIDGDNQGKDFIHFQPVDTSKMTAREIQEMYIDTSNGRRAQIMNNFIHGAGNNEGSLIGMSNEEVLKELARSAVPEAMAETSAFLDTVDRDKSLNVGILNIRNINLKQICDELRGRANLDIPSTMSDEQFMAIIDRSIYCTNKTGRFVDINAVTRELDLYRASTGQENKSDEERSTQDSPVRIGDAETSAEVSDINPKELTQVIDEFVKSANSDGPTISSQSSDELVCTMSLKDITHLIVDLEYIKVEMIEGAYISRPVRIHKTDPLDNSGKSSITATIVSD